MATTYVKARELPEPAVYTVARQVGMDHILPLCRGTKAQCEAFIRDGGYYVVSEFNGRMYVI